MMAACLVGACAPDAPQLPDAPADPWLPPDVAGPWPVGARTDAFEGRTSVGLPVHVWYPAHPFDGEAATYLGLPGGVAVVDAPPACADGPRPVVVFSHGSGGFPAQSWFLTEHLAARGFVVVAPEHTGNTTFDQPASRRAELAVRRPDDVADAFSWLVERSLAADDPLAGCVDPDAGYAAVGHSFGGYTTLAVAGAPLALARMRDDCAPSGFPLCDAADAWDVMHPGRDDGDLSDPRVWAAVPLAPAAISALGGNLGRIRVPVLLIGALEDRTTPWEVDVLPVYEELVASPRVLTGLSPAGHYSFTDFCIYPDDGCDPQRFVLADAHDQITVLVAAFLEDVLGEARAAAYVAPGPDAVVWESVP